MGGLFVEKAKCTGCGLCVKSCAADALSIVDKKAAVSNGCTMCGLCISGCPFGALSMRGGQSQAGDGKNLWIIAEQNEGELARVSYELTGKGRLLADERGCELLAVLAGKNCEANALRLIEAGADRVIICPDDRLENNSDEPYAEYVSSVIEKYRPEAVLCGATRFGRSLAPRVAARLSTGLTADCTGLEIDPETRLLQQTRPAFGGNLMATIICPDRRPQMATVRPGVMPSPALDGRRAGEIIRESLPDKLPGRTELLEKIRMAGPASISGAEKIIVAGRGIGNQKNLRLAREAAGLIGAELGCSRPLIDLGWCGYRHQVGQTGCTVAPRLLISVGVSGAVQHQAGIARAEKIIAVNHDPDAPIFDIAHYAVVGDAIEILTELIDVLKSKKDRA